MSTTPSRTVFLRGQMARGGYLKIDKNGDLTIAENEEDRNPRKNVEIK